MEMLWRPAGRNHVNAASIIGVTSVAQGSAQIAGEVRHNVVSGHLPRIAAFHHDRFDRSPWSSPVTPTVCSRWPGTCFRMQSSSRPKQSSVNVRVSTCGSHAEIQVSDNGQGIEPTFCLMSSSAFARLTAAPPASRRTGTGTSNREASGGDSRWHRGSRERRQKQRREVHGEIAVTFYR